MKTPFALLLKSFAAFTIATALGASAWAEASSSEYQDVEKVDVAQRPATFDKARKAIFRIGGVCTATFVSNDGYVLTAEHCLLADLQWKFKLESFADMKFSIMKFDPQMIGQEFSTTISFDGKDATQVKAKVVAVGKGFFNNIDPITAFKGNPEKYYDVMEEGYGPAEDYAVLKLDLEGTTCLPVAAESVAVGDPVWSIGYPVRWMIGGRPLWSGQAAAFSSGQITHGAADNEINREILKNDSAEYKEAYLGVVGAMDNEETLTASVDGVGGASGGSVLNKNGEIVGVMAMTSTASRGRYYYGTTKLNKAQTTVQKLIEKLGEAQANKIFSCH